VKAFFNITENDSFEAGCQALMEITGLGKLRPNMILMGYKENWRTCDEEELQQYFNVIQLVTCFSLTICGLTLSLLLRERSQLPINFPLVTNCVYSDIIRKF
jgi:solute carrier family 12 sodium/potassium/chloride transporter 2